MGRCPVYLNVDDFDTLAKSLDKSLTDSGAGALGEITEYIATQIILQAANGKSEPLDFDAIIQAAKSLGVNLDIDLVRKKVTSASF